MNLEARMFVSGLQVDQGAEHLVRSFHHLRGQPYLMTTGHLFNGIAGKNFRGDRMNGNAAAGNIDPLHTGLDALKSNRQGSGDGHG